VEEVTPAFPVLVGVTLLLRLGPVAQLVAAFGHAQAGPLLPFGGQRELDELGVALDGFLAAGVVPAEREAGRRIDRLHDDRAALVPEPHIAVGTRLYD